MASVRRIAVLGAGLMGTAAAIRLARDGHTVTLFDQHLQPLQGASRWNEGKIHLGFLYAADPTFRSAGRLLQGGLQFRPLIERLIGRPIARVTDAPDTFLVHRDSVVSVDAARTYFRALAASIREHPDAGEYLVDVRRADVKELSAADLGAMSSDAVVGGFVVPEHSVDTRWIADQLTEILYHEPRVTLCLGTRVLGVRPRESRTSRRYGIEVLAGTHDGFDVVVNALWEGRPTIDRALGLPLRAPWSHRYRVAIFADTAAPVEVKSFVLCTGPFGDVKRYSPRHFYLSWYPTGLLASSEEVEPPSVPALSDEDRAIRTSQTIEALAAVVPGVRAIAEAAVSMDLRGGWVFAQGRGSLSDPASTLHRRDQIGISGDGTYYSVDTGKYSVAPFLADQLAGLVSAAPR